MKISKLIMCTVATFLCSTYAQAQSAIACWGQDFGKRPLQIVLAEKTATFSFGGSSCVLTNVPYNPRSGSYLGWIRYGNKNTHNSKYETACSQVMAKFYNQEGSNPNENPDVHWISVSKEIQQTGNGRLQLGYENLWDPGAGGTVKAMLGCRPDARFGR